MHVCMPYKLPVNPNVAAANLGPTSGVEGSNIFAKANASRIRVWVGLNPLGLGSATTVVGLCTKQNGVYYPLANFTAGRPSAILTIEEYGDALLEDLYVTSSNTALVLMGGELVIIR